MGMSGNQKGGTDIIYRETAAAANDAAKRPAEEKSAPQYAKNKKKTDDIKNLLEQVATKLDDSQAQAKEATAKCATAQQQADELRTELADSQAQFEEATAKCATALQQADELRTELADSQAQAEEATAKCATAQQQADELRTELADSQAHGPRKRLRSAPLHSSRLTSCARSSLIAKLRPRK